MDNGTPNPRFLVLGAVDDSPMAGEVVRVGANLACSVPGGELHLVHVLENLPPRTGAVPRPPGLGITTGEIAAAARTKLEALATEVRAGSQGRTVIHLAAGSAWKQILQVAIDVQADVVLVGTHGRTGIKRMILGSVAEAVVRKAACPVIVVRAKDYHALVPPEIEPACPDCLRTQRDTAGARLWCDRHSEHHPRGHVHYELPQGFGGGWQLL